MSIRDCIDDILVMGDSHWLTDWQVHSKLSMLIDKYNKYSEVPDAFDISHGISYNEFRDAKLPPGQWSLLLTQVLEGTLIPENVLLDIRPVTNCCNFFASRPAGSTPYTDFLIKVNDAWLRHPENDYFSHLNIFSSVARPLLWWLLFPWLRTFAEVADFYFLDNLLRTICQSEREFSALLNSEESQLQTVLNFLDERATALLRRSRVYGHFKYWKNHVFLAIARRRGLTPSSFHIWGIVKIGNELVGRGGFSDVWKGESTSKQTLALKVLKQYDLGDAQHAQTLKSLSREAVVWKMIQSPFVLKFSGLCRVDNYHTGGAIALASPWMKHGNLIAYVQSHENSNRPKLLSQIARGLIYLHSIGVVHGDLKCANIMVNDEGIAQLSDFGLSTVGDAVHPGNVSGSLSNSAGHPRWLAPELMFPEKFAGSGKFTPESDVYAFGMTALELFTEKVPFAAHVEAALPFEVVEKGLRPAHPGIEAETRGLSDTIWRLMQSCWDQDAASRPSTLVSDSVISEFAISRSLSDKIFKIDTFSGNFSNGRLLQKGFGNRDGLHNDVWIIELVKKKAKNITKISCKVLQIEVSEPGPGSHRILNELKGMVSVATSSELPSHETRNVAQLLGMWEILPPVKVTLMYRVDPSAERLLDHLRRKGVVWRLGILDDILRGLQHLHELGFVHGNLRSTNVIVEYNVVKLVDYGLHPSARIKTDASDHAALYQAPEISEIPMEIKTTESDMFALATTFFDVLTDCIPGYNSPLHELKLIQDMLRVGKKLRCSYPDFLANQRGLTPELWGMMLQCWSPELEKRPSTYQLRACIFRSRGQLTGRT